MFFVLVKLKYIIIWSRAKFRLIQPGSKLNNDIFQFYKDLKYIKKFRDQKQVFSNFIKTKNIV